MEGKETGSVKSYSLKNSWGFITQDSGGDLFVYGKDVGRINEPGYLTLIDGERVKFDARKGRYGRPQAFNITVPARHTAPQEAGIVESFDKGAGFGRIISDVDGTVVFFHKIRLSKRGVICKSKINRGTAINCGSWTWPTVTLKAPVEYKATRRPDGEMQAFYVTGRYGLPLGLVGPRQPTRLGQPEGRRETGGRMDFSDRSSGKEPGRDPLPRASKLPRGGSRGMTVVGGLLPQAYAPPTQGTQGGYNIHGPLPLPYGPPIQGYQGYHGALVAQTYAPPREGIQGGTFGGAVMAPAYGHPAHGPRGMYPTGGPLPYAYRPPAQAPQGLYPVRAPLPQAYRPPAQAPQGFYPVRAPLPRVYRPAAQVPQGLNPVGAPLPQPHGPPRQGTQQRNNAGGPLPHADGRPRRGSRPQGRALAGGLLPQPDGPPRQETDQRGNIAAGPLPHAQ